MEQNEEMTLVQQGYFLLKINNFSSAAELFSKSLEKERDPQALIGLLLAKNALENEEQLSALPQKLDRYEEFSEALERAEPAYRAQLEKIADEQTAVLARKEEKYVSMLDSDGNVDKKENDFKELLACAIELNGYKDSNTYREKYEKELARIDEQKKIKRKKKLKIIIPVVIAAAALIIAAGFIFAMPKINGVRYAITLNGYVVLSADKDLESVDIEDKIFGISVRRIGKGAFENCENLKTVNLPSGIEQIGGSAFENCRRLTTVNGTQNVMLVKKEAFKDCKSLTELHFDRNVEIAKTAFKDCRRDLKIYFGKELWQPGFEPLPSEQRREPKPDAV